MADPHFAVAIIGADDDQWRAPLCDALRDRTKGLGESDETLAIVDEGNLSPLSAAGAGVAVILGRGQSVPQTRQAAIAECGRLNIPLFPVVADLARFDQLVPDLLLPYNGFELRHPDDIGELAGLILEALGLQRTRRKVFISYARKDSSDIANQLREALTARWYTVFHDTVSIRPGRDFQEELLQELADSDVMLLLNNASTKGRFYVEKEIAFANLAGIGGVQVLWPGVEPRGDAGFFTRVDLGEPGRMEGSVLSDDGVALILSRIAESRTALQDMREARLVLPIVDYARRQSWRAVRHLGRFVRLDGPADTRPIRLPFALGVPTSFELQRTFSDAGEEGQTAALVYDPLGLTERQSDHIYFLGQHLPLELLDYKSPSCWHLIP